MSPFGRSPFPPKWVPSFMDDPYFQTHIYPPSRQFLPWIYDIIFISGKWCGWWRCKLAYCESNYISAIFPFVEETGIIFNSFLNFRYFHFGMHMHNQIHCIFSGIFKNVASSCPKGISKRKLLTFPFYRIIWWM